MPPKFSKELKVRLSSGYQPRRQHRTSPCEAVCPAGNPIQAMESLLKEGKREEAHKVLLSRNPFPGVTGRVCPHPCESKCNRNEYDEGLAIRALERFAADSPGALSLRAGEPTGKKAVIVGSGPAGLSCAYFLRLLGHEVDLLEASPVLGGTPRLAVPDFRLPKNVADREAGAILALGVTAHTNVEVGKTVSLESLLNRYDACVLAVGNRRERRLNIPGIDGARSAVEFLSANNLHREDLSGRKVVVLGGGGVAFDCGFTALRLGAASASLICPECEADIKVPAEEVEQAKREGLHLYPSHLAISMNASGMEAQPLESFCFDERGELQAKAAQLPPLHLDADLVICASGLLPDLDFAAGRLPELTPRGLLKVDELMATSIPGLYAAGDIAEGPSSVAQAVGSGRRAAFGIHRALSGESQAPQVEFREEADGVLRLAVTGVAPAGEPVVVEFKDIQNPNYHEKAPRRTTQAGDMPLPFAELDLGFRPEDAQAEAERCMHCGHCIDCGTCVERCPNYILEREEKEGPHVVYPEECWHCACCRIGCPTGSISIEFPITMLV